MLHARPILFFSFPLINRLDTLGSSDLSTSNNIFVFPTIFLSINNLREKFLACGAVDRLGGLVVIAPAHKAGDPGSNPGPDENFFS